MLRLMPLIPASLGTDPVMLITLSRNSSVDEISERYNLNYDIVAVKLLHPTNNFPVTFAYLVSKS